MGKGERKTGFAIQEHNQCVSTQKVISALPGDPVSPDFFPLPPSLKINKRKGEEGKGAEEVCARVCTRRMGSDFVKA